MTETQDLSNCVGLSLVSDIKKENDFQVWAVLGNYSLRLSWIQTDTWSLHDILSAYMITSVNLLI